MELISFNNFEKVNEDMHVASKIKLRDSIHDIMIKYLKPGEEMGMEELSEKLKEEHNIKIPPTLLEVLLFENWWRKDDYSIFREKDKKWLDVWPYRKTVEYKKRKTSPSLGKGRRKIEKEERAAKYQQNTRVYYPNRVYQGGTTSKKYDPNDPYYDDYGYGYW